MVIYEKDAFNHRVKGLERGKRGRKCENQLAIIIIETENKQKT